MTRHDANVAHLGRRNHHLRFAREDLFFRAYNLDLHRCHKELPCFKLPMTLDHGRAVYGWLLAGAMQRFANSWLALRADELSLNGVLAIDQSPVKLSPQ